MRNRSLYLNEYLDVDGDFLTVLCNTCADNNMDEGYALTIKRTTISEDYICEACGASQTKCGSDERPLNE